MEFGNRRGCYTSTDLEVGISEPVRQLFCLLDYLHRVESSPGSREDATRCTSYPVFKGLVPNDFEGDCSNVLAIEVAHISEEG